MDVQSRVPLVSESVQDFMPITGTDYVELYVSNALQAAHYYRTAFGFQPLAYKGLETGDKEATSYVVAQDKIRLVLTAALHGEGVIAKHVAAHGDGVRTIALTVPDARSAFEESTKRGAKAFLAPTTAKDKNGQVIIAGIHTYGDTIHLFVERHNYTGVFLPGYTEWSDSYHTESVGLRYIDHMVGNVPLGEMKQWCAYYAKVMGFTQLVSFDDKDISTEYTALMSKVMQNGNGRIKFPINEPAPSRKRNQIDEYLEFYGGAGVQHIAVAAHDIVDTVRALCSRGVDFLHVPKEYYEALSARVGSIDEDVATLAELGILVDRDEEGYLLQIFTKPISSRPTLFFEIIQRKGARSFGKGNFKALFEAIEREQARRGTL